MPGDQVALVSDFVRFYNARDLKAAVALCSEDVAVTPDFPGSEPFRGREAYRHLLEETWDGWESGAVVVRASWSTPDGRVLFRAVWHARAARSGIEVSTDLSWIVAVRDGEISAVAYFFDHAEALEVAGLRE
jgi:ketosteroid isomerase-like protein